MNLEPLRHKLLSAARANPPDEQVPYAFEKRVMAHLGARPALDFGAVWARGLWRAAAPCVAVSLVLLGVLSFVGTETNSVSDETAPDLEETMLAVIDSSEEGW